MKIDAKAFWKKLWTKKFVGLIIVAVCAGIGYSCDETTIAKITELFCSIAGCAG